MVSERARALHDPWRHQGVSIDEEPDGAGGIVRAATVFLTGRECPWRCVMCDLWRHTLTDDTPIGAIPHQIGEALASIDPGETPHLKLYNAGSFFDRRAVPPVDDDAIAASVSDFARVVVESHPALVGDRTWRFQERLARAGVAQLEVAMGLETACPEALARLDKHITVESFADAARQLAVHGVRLRVFLLVSPPFIEAASQDHWLAESVSTAFACGASVVSIIPTRSGNAALDPFEASGEFRAPHLDDLERSLDIGLRVAASLGGGDRVVLADLWDLARFSTCRVCVDARRDRLAQMNATQQVRESVRRECCERCEAAPA